MHATLARIQAQCETKRNILILTVFIKYPNGANYYVHRTD